MNGEAHNVYRSTHSELKTPSIVLSSCLCSFMSSWFTVYLNKFVQCTNCMSCSGYLRPYYSEFVINNGFIYFRYHRSPLVCGNWSLENSRPWISITIKLPVVGEALPRRTCGVRGPKGLYLELYFTAVLSSIYHVNCATADCVLREYTLFCPSKSWWRLYSCDWRHF